MKAWAKQKLSSERKIVGLHEMSGATGLEAATQVYQFISKAIDDRKGEDGEWIYTGEEESVVVFFPNCEEILANYDKFALMDLAYTFSSSTTYHWGKKEYMTLETHYHPNLELLHDKANAPRSPYPAFLISFAANDDEKRDEKIENERQSQDQPSEALQRTKTNLAFLLNRAASSSFDDVLDKSNAERQAIVAESDELVEERMKLWAKGSKVVAKTDIQEGMVVCRASSAENCYKEIFELILRLAASHEKVAVVRAGAGGGTGAGAGAGVGLDWISSLMGEKFLPNIQEHHQQKIASKMFVVPSFCSFNAEKFKVFAVALNLTCEKLTGDKVFVEAFHPEYVAKKKGFSNNLRRAPHPALLLCYRGE
ncbi:hypothetical protein ScalyP_jg1037 [Parmales sp. scaly parma]|nr:hypothetical protein ScalyP_jg1037 [Parmales sp. scaly parma]